MSRWYKISKYRIDIISVEVVKETEKQIVVRHPASPWGVARDIRTAKEDSSESHYPTFAQAQAQAVAYRLTQIEAAQSQIRNWESEIQKIQILQEPQS